MLRNEYKRQTLKECQKRAEKTCYSMFENISPGFVMFCSKRSGFELMHLTLVAKLQGKECIVVGWQQSTWKY